MRKYTTDWLVSDSDASSGIVTKKVPHDLNSQDVLVALYQKVVGAGAWHERDTEVDVLDENTLVIYNTSDEFDVGDQFRIVGVG